MTPTAPFRLTAIGYASKDRQACTTSSPASQNASSRWPSTATEPQPATTADGCTPCRAASASTRSTANMSGYLLISAAARATASRTPSRGGNGFSLDDSLKAPVSPARAPGT